MDAETHRGDAPQTRRTNMVRRSADSRWKAGLMLAGLAAVVAAPVAAGVPVWPRSVPLAGAPLLIPVQERGDPGSNGGGGGGGEGRDRATTAPAATPAATTATLAPAMPQATVTAQATQAISEAVGEAFDSCRTLTAGYQIDCMSQQLRSVAAQVAPGGAYGPVNIALEQAARKLAEIARRDRDGGQPRVSIQHRGQSGVRTYAAVRTDTLAQSRAAAARVLDEVQTVLLRSAANSGNRRAHFQRIAAAMESGKVLLRSS